MKKSVLLCFIFTIIFVYGVQSSLTPGYTGRACPGTQTFTCEVTGNEVTWVILNGNSTPIIQTLRPSTNLDNLMTGDFIVSATFSFDMQSDMSVSTLSVLLDSSSNGVVLDCEDVTSTIVGNVTIELAARPSLPQNLMISSQVLSNMRVDVTIRWIPPTDNGGRDDLNYTVTISPLAQLSATIITSTSVTVSANYNVDYTVSVVATNCAENSDTKDYSFRINGCPPLMDPANGAFGTVTNRSSGAITSFQCDPGYTSTVEMVRCEGADPLMWSPDPGTVVCSPLTQPPPTTPPPMNCTAQVAPPLNGSVSDHSVPAVPGTNVTFYCDFGLFPTENMTVTCLASGDWDRKPMDIVCRERPISCDLPDPPLNSLPLNTNTNTTEGSVILFQCEPGFSLEGGGTITCNNSGLWSPDPALLMCTSPAVPVNSAPIVGGVVGGLIAVIMIILIVIVLLVILTTQRKKELKSYVSSSDDMEMVDKLQGEYSELRHEGPKKKNSKKSHPPPTGSDEYDRVTHNQGPGSVTYDDVTIGSDQRAEDGYSKLSNGQGAQRLPGYGQLHNVPTVEPVVYAALGVNVKTPTEAPEVDQHVVTYATVDITATNRQKAATMPTSTKNSSAEQADKLLNLDQALVQLRPVQSRWQELGQALQVPDTYIQQIDESCGKDHANSMTEVVDYWMRSCSGQPTWRELADALKRIKENHLAKQLMSIYETGRLPVELDMNEVPKEVYKYDNAPPPPLPARSPTITDDTDSPGLSKTLPPSRPPKYNGDKGPSRPPKPPRKNESPVPPRPPKPPPKH